LFIRGILPHKMNGLSTQISGPMESGARYTTDEAEEIMKFTILAEWTETFLSKLMIMIIKRAGFLFTVFCLAVASPASKGQAEAYVLPSHQLLHFMAAHFSKFETLIITHSVERESGEGILRFEETITMKSPDLLHAAPVEEIGNQTRGIDRSFRSLFLANSQTRLRDLLRGAGVDLDRVSYTRVGGTVAYLIGARGAFSPRLAVGKGRFLPLAFFYPSGLTLGPEFIRVTFQDFRQVDQGWYPFEILCRSDAGWSERYSVLSIQVNAPVDPSLFHSLRTGPLPAESPHKDERIGAIIKSLEQKHGR
jgi:hypothetical protein